MDLQPGQIVDRYTVGDQLGRGGMAVVYRVRHNTLGTEHALKVLSLNVHSIVERLIQEGRVQAQLQHPNIVAVTDVLDVQGSPGLLMELVRGPSLEDWLATNEPSLDEALRLFREILSALQEAHRLDIVHRDLKPGNVMLSTQRGGLQAKVTDFGLAKLLVDEASPTQTCTGLPMGTPAYMSPEQITDAKSVDRRTDIFALGCILYELVCGRMAFEGANTLEVFNAVAGGIYVPPRQLEPDLPDPVVRAIQGCLRGQREQRIPSCEALEAVLAGGALHPSDAPTMAPAAVPPDALAARPALSRRELPRQPAATPTFALSDSLDGGSAAGESGTESGPTLSPGTVASPLPPAPVSAPTPRPAPKQRARWWLLLALVALVLVVGSVLALGGVLATWWLASPVQQAEFVDAPELSPPGEHAVPVAPPDPEREAHPQAPLAPLEGEPLQPGSGAGPALAPGPEPAAPVEQPASFGVVNVDGDAVSVVLVDGNGRRRSPGRLPPGVYDLEASFASGATIRQPGRVTVTAGRSITLRCVELLETCR
jgi:serine/threonine protein kinase